MKTAVKPTSIAAYGEHKATGKMGREQAIIYSVIKHHGMPITRRQIAKHLVWETSTVAARVNELIEDGRVAVSGKGQCPVSHRRVELLVVGDINGRSD